MANDSNLQGQGPSDTVPGGQAPVDEVDIEEHALAGRGAPPPAKRYVIRIDRQKYTVTVPEMSGKDILALAGHTPASHKLYQKLRGRKPELVPPEKIVSFREPGIERFQTIPIDPGEGIAPRRDFDLPEEDMQALDERGLVWETVKDGPRRIVLVHDFPTHSGYDHEKALAALQIPDGYNDSQIDMVYFHPPLARRDGKKIGQTDGRVTFDGKPFQQWSRHRTAANPWRPGVDGVGTQLLMVEDWLGREFAKG